MERKGVVLRLGCTASVAGSMVVLELDPPHGTHEGKGLDIRLHWSCPDRMQSCVGNSR